MTITFAQALEETEEIDRTLLLGNGFSIARDEGAFAYSNLLECAGLGEGPIRNIFAVLETFDFEEVMHALEYAAQIEGAYGDEERERQFEEDASVVRGALIHAVREVHPEIQYDIPECQINNCVEFLNNFSAIYTLNYDLLLYWVILNGGGRFADGFGLGGEENGFRTFSEDAHCSTYYLHGALHLFLGGEYQTQKKILRAGTIVDEITRTIQFDRRLPLFVSEGTQSKKMAKINSVPYLRHCYEMLSSVSGSLFIFGNSISQNDRHIYNAIFRSDISHLYVCVHELTQNLQHIRERIAPYCARNEEINVQYVDSDSAYVWDRP